MKRLLCLTAAALTLTALLSAGSVAQKKDTPKDARYGKPKDYNGYFPWTPPTSKEAWERRKQEVREQLLVANGLWPMPEKTPLHPVIHGKIERDGYTIEKVYFASRPGFYVCGNLYRPTGKSGKLPAVLSPHGHWANGRFYDAGEKEAKKQIASGAETTMAGARYPLQARCAQLARMGCVVFHYDMIGYADSQQITHRTGFLDVEAELRLQSFMGQQTWNTIRALDFLTSLPDVDPARIGVTGASGGGTQTFILCALDARPAAAFPAVMVGTAMQGGCICENCSYLRVGTGNVEIAGMFAPKPLGMSGADDWTIDIETKGLPELKALYRLYGAEDKVFAKTYKQFKHNYNQMSRELMYNWFNQHLKLGLKEPVKEQPFVPVPPKELSVFDKEHPLPKDAVNAAALRRELTAESEKQLEALLPKDAKTLEAFRRVEGTALRVMIGDTVASQHATTSPPTPPAFKDGGNVAVSNFVITRKGREVAIPATWVHAKRPNDAVVIWVDADGHNGVLDKDGKLTAAAKAVWEKGAHLLAIDPYRTDVNAQKERPPVNKQFAGYTFGYNRPLLSERVSDILTAVDFVKGTKVYKRIHLVGVGEAGPWVLLARGLCGDAVQRTAVDLNGFRFEQIKDMNDPMMLPGGAEVRRPAGAGGAGGAGRAVPAQRQGHRLVALAGGRVHRRRGAAGVAAPRGEAGHRRRATMAAALTPALFWSAACDVALAASV